MSKTSTPDMKKAIFDLLDKLNGIEYISPESIPNIDLYMDQITSLWMGS